jgi:hypothetical protein
MTRGVATNIRLIDAKLPDFGVPEEQPRLKPELYSHRHERLMARARERGLDALVIYADREHFANLSWLTGFDPRFEEALLVAVPGRDPFMLVGPENLAPARAASISVEVRLYPPFGLLGQNRAGTRALADILAEAGLSRGMRVGAIGWKYYGRQETNESETWLEIPSFIADAIRRLTGGHDRLVNATAILMDASNGLRCVNELDQLAYFEFAASHASECVKRVLFGVRPGMREYEAAALFHHEGFALSAHMMLSAGPRAFMGLGSPEDRPIERGDPITMALGLWGALTCRAGFLVSDASELPADIRDYVSRLAGPYFACAVEWYETVGIGVTGGEIDALVKRHLGEAFFNLALNPGHLIHLDEWVNTPIYPNSGERLQSGQAIQLDIIPATGTPYFTSNIEDGIALLDEPGRAEFAERYPAAWKRIGERRAFMADVLGIHLRPDVLPLSNLAGYLPPFILSPQRVFAR